MKKQQEVFPITEPAVLNFPFIVKVHDYHDFDFIQSLLKEFTRLDIQFKEFSGSEKGLYVAIFNNGPINPEWKESGTLDSIKVVNMWGCI